MLIDNKYEVIRELGRGTQGEVLLVKKAGPKNVIYALKTIRTENISLINKPETEVFFINEFKLIKNLEHTNIIKVHDFGFIAETSRYYYTMDYIPGANISDFLKSEKLNKDDLTELIYQILCGLNYLHANNVVHFDIKPENILVYKTGDKLNVKLVDFGLSGLGSLEKQKIRGTLCYMAPELFVPNSPITNKIDLYSLGVTILVAVMQQTTSPTSTSVSGFLNRTKSVLNFNLQLLENLDDRLLKEFLTVLIEPDPALRINSAYEAIALLNSIYHKNYLLPVIWSLESCEHNSRFLAREEIFQSIVRSVEHAHIMINGESGCGLSRILQRLNYHLSLNLLKVIYFDKNDIDSQPLDKLQQESTAILKSILQKKNSPVITADVLENTDQNTQTREIIRRITEQSQLYLLIDDLDKFENSFIELVSSLAGQPIANCRIITTVTTPKNNSTNNIKAQLLQRDRNFSHHELHSLNKAGISELLIELFGKIINLPADFAQDMLKATAGNFRQIMQKLDLFIKNKIITGYKELFIYADSDHFAEKILLTSHKENYIPASFKQIFRHLLFAPLGLPRESMSAISGLDTFSLTALLDHLSSQALLRTRIVNGRKYYYLTDRYDYARQINASAGQLFLIIKTVIKETAQILHFRSKEEQSYLTILSEFLKSEQEIINLWTTVQKNQESRVRFFYLTVAPFIVQTPENRLFLLLELTKELIKIDNRKTAIRYLKMIRYQITRNNLAEYRWQFVYLQLSLHDDVHYAIKPNLFLKEYNLLLSKLDFPDFLSIAVTMAESFLQSRYSVQSIKILARIKETVQNHSSEYRFFSYLLESYEIFYNIIPWQDEHLTIIERYLDDFTQNGIFSQEYFKTLYNYVSYFTLFRNRSSDTRFLKYLQQGLTIARDTQNYQFLLMFSNHLGLYYRNSGQDAAAIKIYENIINNEKKVRFLNRSNIINNLALIKYDTQMPVNEVLYLFQEACAEQRRYASLSSYSVQLSNISVLNFEAGNFPESARYLDEQLNYFSFLGSIYHEPLLNYIPKYAAYFMKKEELAIRLKEVCTKDFTKMSERLEQCYNYVLDNKIETFYQPEWLQPDGNFRLESLEITLHLTIKNKKLPESKTVMQNIGSQFTSEKYPENNLIYLMLRFIYSPADSRLAAILKQLYTLQLNGYRWIICLHLTRFLIFVTIMKISLPDAPAFYKLLRDNLEMINSRCTDSQKICFKKTYLVKTAVKLLKKNFCNYEL